MSSWLRSLDRKIKKQWEESGMMDAMKARDRHFNDVARKLGFADRQEAFHMMGEEFVRIARKGAPSINEAKRKYEQSKKGDK